VLVGIKVERSARAGDGTGSYDYRFGAREVFVGRSPNADVRLPDAAISLVHLKLEERDQRVHVVDLGSTNGTLLDGERIQPQCPVPADVGAQIEVGSYVLRLVSPDRVRRVTSKTDTATYARQMLREMLGATPGQGVLAWLEIVAGPDRGRRFPIDVSTTRLTIGRGAGCDVALADVDASREHAEVRVEQERATIVDFGSKNGLFVDEQRVEGAVELRHGAQIRIGSTVLAFRDCTQQRLEELQEARDKVLGEQSGVLAGDVSYASASIRTLSAQSAFELASARLVHGEPQIAADGGAAPPTRKRVDVWIAVAAAGLVATAGALIAYLIY
jgi:pSer/pThr/pTyr-binding forkhead associated (FHA) protein